MAVLLLDTWQFCEIHFRLPGYILGAEFEKNYPRIPSATEQPCCNAEGNVSVSLSSVMCDRNFHCSSSILTTNMTDRIS